MSYYLPRTTAATIAFVVFVTYPFVFLWIANLLKYLIP